MPAFAMKSGAAAVYTPSLAIRIFTSLYIMRG
jgi:hypothetical protein